VLGVVDGAVVDGVTGVVDGAGEDAELGGRLRLCADGDEGDAGGDGAGVDGAGVERSAVE